MVKIYSGVKSQTMGFINFILQEMRFVNGGVSAQRHADDAGAIRTSPASVRSCLRSAVQVRRVAGRLLDLSNTVPALTLAVPS